jgi:heat-inducible transcriptional repressor
MANRSGQLPQKTTLRLEDLEPRFRDVLREIVLEYVESGEPISSRSLAKSGRFGLSPATLRNVMADLEDLGFLHQPHTSAGRIPTDRGYRYFIDHLMRSRRLSQLEREQIDDEVGRADEVDDMMHHSSRLLSKLSDQVGMIFMPKLNQLVMRSIDFIPVSDTKVMCVIVGTNGVVVNRILEVPAVRGREELERISRYLTSEFAGFPLESFLEALRTAVSGDRAREDRDWRESIEFSMNAVQEVVPVDEELCVEGAMSVIRKPEFSEGRALSRIAVVLEHKRELASILGELLLEGGTQILVGSESSFTRAHNASLVVTSYGPAGRPLGLVGILGPTRMEYARMAPLADYLAKALSRKIEETEQENDS